MPELFTILLGALLIAIHVGTWGVATYGVILLVIQALWIIWDDATEPRP